MILERRLVFRGQHGSDPTSLSIRIGEPNFPAKTPGMEQFFGCPIEYGLRGTRPHEVFGMDAMQAVGAAFCVVHIFIKEMATKGTWYWEDGRLYNLDGESPLPLEKQQATYGVDIQIDRRGEKRS